MDKAIKNIREGTAVWEEDVVIPTYPVGEPNKNPMFLEKRVYQGSSGKVYPHSVIDRIGDEKEDRVYHAVFLENRYLHIMILPELGGRIQRALDKTNGYDFVYYNHVIKPALVGLNGPWISGGIEFNWPQHHRPSTFDPVGFVTLENPDGSCSVVVSEIENMFRTKGSATFTLHPDKAYLQIDARLYNRTDMPQTFLWWANPAVAVNDHTQSVFPPDVHAVMDHGKRDVSSFPIATGSYYKQDYSAGVDISRYKNIPVPTSYMAYHSDYDFVGGYDHGVEAGILHIADHHISPGKKQWTWGCGDFGQAWDRNLTDEDGPYIELMTGCFTDNQPDFSWLAPYEEKTFTQYFLPYKKAGMVKNATIDAAVSLETKDGVLRAAAYVTSPRENTRVVVRAAGSVLEDRVLSLSPEEVYAASFPLPADTEESACSIEVYDGNRLLAAYQPMKKHLEKLPEPAKAAPDPKDVPTTEDLYLYGLHLEQYRHATYEPADYYIEGLRRDPTDIRLNNAYGRLLLRRGRFAEAKPYFEAAIRKMTRSNPNPYDGEPYFHLGMCLRYLDDLSGAYDAFFKATWNEAWQAAGFYQLACIDCRRGSLYAALGHVEHSLIYNRHNMKARTLRTALLRRLGSREEAAAFATETLAVDPADLAALYERGETGELWRQIGGNANTLIELALEYSAAGLLEEAAGLLRDFADRQEDPQQVYPLVWYHLGYILDRAGKTEEASEAFRLAGKAEHGVCFPHRLEDILVLSRATAVQPADARAPYYLGCLWYDKKQYEDAIACWELSASLEPDFPTVHRNLSLAYFNKRRDGERAQAEMETAYRLNPADSRVLMELDQLYKKRGHGPLERLDFLRAHQDVVADRDDLTLEFITLLNQDGRYEEAMEMLAARRFHPWEGGEGKAPAQYIFCRVELAKRLLDADPEKAIRLLTEAKTYPHNLGEGKLAGAQENNVDYYLGRAYERLGRPEKAKDCYERASRGLTEPAGMMYYNDQPPETIFYQGLALLRLGREAEASSRFHKLIAYGEKHIFDHIRIEYFAVSLPDLQIFEEDLDVRNRVHCLYMRGLGHLGLGERTDAAECLREAAALDKNHGGVRLHLALLDMPEL